MSKFKKRLTNNENVILCTTNLMLATCGDLASDQCTVLEAFALH